MTRSRSPPPPASASPRSPASRGRSRSRSPTPPNAPRAGAFSPRSPSPPGPAIPRRPTFEAWIERMKAAKKRHAAEHEEPPPSMWSYGPHVIEAAKRLTSIIHRKERGWLGEERGYASMAAALWIALKLTGVKADLPIKARHMERITGVDAGLIIKSECLLCERAGWRMMSVADPDYKGGDVDLTNDDDRDYSIEFVNLL